MNLRGRVLSLLWARLHRTMKQQLLSACEELELSEAFAEAQTERYSRYGEVDYDAHHSRLLAWVVARCGYESRTTSVAFEEDLPSTATGPLVAPGWVLGIAPVV